MRFGIGISTCREGYSYPAGFAGPKEMVEAAQLAERLGFDSVWGDDHLNPGKALMQKDPQPPNFYELLISLSYVAAATKRVRLGAGVIVIPLRDPVLVAKQVATLDVFSGGRLILALGIGLRHELETINPRGSKGNRGKMLDEGLEVLHLLFNQNVASYKGKYYEFEEVALFPKPLQKPFPIYLSGTVEETPVRTAKWGRGCFVAPSVEDITGRVNDLRPLLTENGRDLSEIDIITITTLSMARSHKEAVERFQRSRVGERFKGKSWEQMDASNIIGTPSEVAEKIRQLQRAGLTHCGLQRFAAANHGEMMEQVQMFGEEVLPLFRSG